MRARTTILLVTVLVLVAVPASAQSRWRVTPYAGVLFTDGDFANTDESRPFLDDPSVPPGPTLDIRDRFEVEDAAVFGVRIGVAIDAAWSVEAAYGYASFPVRLVVDVTAIPGEPPERVEFTESDHAFHLWTASARYAFPRGGVRPFLAGGVGAARISTSFPILGDVEDFDESATDLLVDVGGGILWPIREASAIRIEIRDHLQWCDEVCYGGDPVLHQVELSGGLEVEL